MTIKDRFLDYWTHESDEYAYDLSIFEMILYGMVGCVGFAVLIVGIIYSIPIWGIPYILYKAHKIKGTEHDQYNRGIYG